MKRTGVAEHIISWAQNVPSILAIVQIGSRVQSREGPSAADEFSDWDFQVVTSRRELFYTRAWLRTAGIVEPLAYTLRSGSVGNVMKVSAVFPDGEVDIVLLPAFKMRVARIAVGVGLVSRLKVVRSALGELGIFLRPGYCLLKGTRSWGLFFEYVAREIPLPRLDDKTVAALAEAFVCDSISAYRKIQRGEFIAAQRLLHLQLAETNFKLLHELRLRQKRLSFYDARRLEKLRDLCIEDVRVVAHPNAQSLSNAVDKCMLTCVRLAAELLGDKWQCPNLNVLHLSIT